MARAVYYCNVSQHCHSRRAGPIASALAAIAVWLCAGPAAGESLGDLYSVTVPYAGQNEVAFREAMRDVLVRATGRRDAADLESLAPIVANASRYVVSYRRATGGQLTVTFDGAAIEDAIDASGLPSWGAERPTTLVWLALDRGGGRRALVSAATGGDEKTLVDQSAARRGLPLAWPGPGDDLVRALQQAWSGDHAPLVAAATRYGAEGVLIGRATPAAGGQYTVEWTFVAAGLSAQASGPLESGPELAADRYASLFATPGAGARTEQLVTVTGIDSLERYASALRVLSRLPQVRDVAVDEVTPDGVSFLVRVRGDPEGLRQAIQKDGRLTAVDASRLIFSLSP